MTNKFTPLITAMEGRRQSLYCYEKEFLGRHSKREKITKTVI